MSEWEQTMARLIELNGALRSWRRDGVIDSGIHGVDAPLLVVGPVVVQVRGVVFVVDRTDEFGDLVGRFTHPVADARGLARVLAD
ncbi:hypothetical protein [Nocardiopsis sp. LOL_012]|uniref:hypothetical protein n=1 Tax=Nocardiopsis sp. LOL_012 TaxID=3345409 RepID=UPI003A85A676